MSDTFKQPVIVPDFLTPPENEGVCVNTGDTIEITPNLQYMMSDQVVVANAVQVRNFNISIRFNISELHL